MTQSEAKERLSCIRTVFLDRDGVLNRKALPGQYVTSVAEFEILDDVPEAINKLNRAGLRVLVVSNQRGVALGVTTESEIEKIHAELKRVLSESGSYLDGIYYCPHNGNSCSCRKPLPGLYHQALADFPDIEPESSVMIGDSLADIEFGLNIGMFTIFIEADPRTQDQGASVARSLADLSFPDLKLAVNAVLAIPSTTWRKVYAGPL